MLYDEKTDNQSIVDNHEMFEVRKLAVQIASKHDRGTVVGVSNVIFNADALCSYIRFGKLPVTNVVERP